MIGKIGFVKSRRGKPDAGVPRPPDVSDEERALFAAAMSDVKPLSGPVRVPVGPARKPVVRTRAAPVVRGTPVVFEADAPADIEVERLGDVITGRAPGVDRKLVKLLRGGEPAPQAKLDLHGKTAAAARELLLKFVNGSAAQGRSCLLVVHGQGHHSASDGPVLKNVVVETLSGRTLSAHVLAFASAPRALGGEGAMLVRLRRTREGRP